MPSSNISGMFAILFVALTAAEELQHLTKKVGEDVTFDLGAQELKYDDNVIWSYGANHTVIYNVYIGDHKGIKQRKRFSLNLITGSLTIQGLSSGDADVYLGQIINGRGIRKHFNLTVVDGDPIPPSPESSPTVKPWLVALVVVLCVLCVGSLIYLVKKNFFRCSLTT
ncbi:uncharacterized protein FYW61_000862 [Anableps anableps]